jgi:hypothetical protein
MSLLLTGAVVGASVTVLAAVLTVVTIGIHQQEHAASLARRRLSLSATLARHILGLHTPTADDPTDQSDNEIPAAKETTR